MPIRILLNRTMDNLDAEAGVLIQLVYDDLIKVEALAVTADKAVTNLPARPRGKYGKTLARLHPADPADPGMPGVTSNTSE